jgi:hypothetical protein
MLLDPRELVGNENFQSKFIRIGNDVYITEPDDLKTLHVDLAKSHNIEERIEFLKNNNPNEVDGGLIFIQSTMIRIGSASSSLGVPLTNEARAITLEKLKKRIPKYSVRELMEN